MDIPFINVNGIDNFKRPKFFSTVSNSPYFKGLMFFILFSEVITTILKSNFKVENHWTSNNFKKLHIFFTFCFFIEFIFNFFTKPRKYFTKLRNTADFIALILSFISLYYENIVYHQNYNKNIQYDYQKAITLPNVEKNDYKADTIQNNQAELNSEIKTNKRHFKSWNYHKKKHTKSPINRGLKFLTKKISLFFSTLCTPRNSPFNLFDVLQSIRLIRVFYMNKYLKTEFKSFMAVTFSVFPILLIFTVFMVCFGFIGNYLYSKGTPSLFSNIFISIFTVFGISTKDMWVSNTKLINKGIENQKKLNVNLNQSNEISYDQITLPKRYLYKLFIPKKSDFGVARQRLDQNELDDQNHLNNLNLNIHKKLNEFDSKSEKDYLINKDKSITEKNTAQIMNENKNNQKQTEKVLIEIENNKEKNSIENKNQDINKNDVINNEKLTFEDLKQMQKTNTRLFKANTIIHNSFEYTLKKRERDSTYTVWFTVSIVTVLGTILSTFVIARITDTFTSGTENLEKKEKRKAIRSVVKLLKKYKNQWIQSTSSETDGVAINSNPELFLSTKQFNEMINILSYLKKSKESLKDFIKENKISVKNYKPPQYDYNYELEYYNQDYYEFQNEDNLKKEVLKRRRLIEELEIMLQFYFNQSQNAFKAEAREEHNTELAHLRQITKDHINKQKEKKKMSLTNIDDNESAESFANTEMMQDSIEVESNELSSSENYINKSSETLNSNNTNEQKIKELSENEIENLNKNNISKNSDDSNQLIETGDENDNENSADKENKTNENNNSSISINNNNNNDDNFINNDTNKNSNSGISNNDNDNDSIENNNSSISINNNNNNNNDNFSNNYSNENNNINNDSKNDNNNNDNYVLKSDSANEITVDQSGSNSVNKLNKDENSIEEISVEDYSQCEDNSYSEEASDAPIQEEFECFGAARNVTIRDVEHFPPPPSTKKTVMFNPQFVRAMKIILRHLINDMERHIELQSALIARLSELSNGT